MNNAALTASTKNINIVSFERVVDGVRTAKVTFVMSRNSKQVKFTTNLGPALISRDEAQIRMAHFERAADWKRTNSPITREAWSHRP